MPFYFQTHNDLPFLVAHGSKTRGIGGIRGSSDCIFWIISLENAVYLELRRRGERLFYAGERDLWECDFVTDSEAIQVTAELTEFNRRCEIGGLVQAVRLPPRRRDAIIITLNQTDCLTVDGISINVLPAWKWFQHVNS